MSGFKRIKDIDDLRENIKEVYDNHKREKHIEDLWDKANYDCNVAKSMNFKYPYQKVSIEKEEVFIDMMMHIFDEVCRNENVPVNSIEVLYYGQVSRVYKVGNKVIKLGGFRYTSTIPNNKYIIKPLLRRFMPVDGSDNGLFIEITEKVNDSAYPSEEELYKIYSDLRDEGIEWADVKPENVGVLLKDNVIHWNEKLDPTSEKTMLDGEVKGEPLKAGDYVILDADLLFRGKAPDEYVNSVPKFYNCVAKFRERYEMEHAPRGLKFFPEAIRRIFGNSREEKNRKSK